MVFVNRSLSIQFGTGIVDRLVLRGFVQIQLGAEHLLRLSVEKTGTKREEKQK